MNQTGNGHCWLLHRDLKPANVLLAEAQDGTIQVKLADFGISILSAQGASGLRPYTTGSVSDSANLAPFDPDVISQTGEDYAEYHISEELPPRAPLELDSTSAFSATMNPDARSQMDSSRVVDPSGASDVDSSAETNLGIGSADPAATPDSHLTATGVLVGTPAPNTTAPSGVRRCNPTPQTWNRVGAGWDRVWKEADGLQFSTLEYRLFAAREHGNNVTLNALPLGLSPSLFESAGL